MVFLNGSKTSTRLKYLMSSNLIPFLHVYNFFKKYFSSLKQQMAESEKSVVPEEIRNRSHKHLSNTIYLIEHTKKSVDFMNNFLNKKKLLLFYTKLYEVLNKFATTFFGYTYPGQMNLYASDVNKELKTCSLYLQELSRVIKIHLAPFLQREKRAHVILDQICSKANTKLQKFLIHVDYWNKAMLACCKVE